MKYAFTISKLALTELGLLANRLGETDPIFTITFGTESNSQRSQFGVGVYKREGFENDASEEDLQVIDGVTFYLDPSVRDAIGGKRLDFSGESFFLE
jgi:hypothetical protein